MADVEMQILSNPEQVQPGQEPNSKKYEDFNDGIFLWTKEFKNKYFLKVRFFITAVLYTSYFLVFFIRCGSCYETKEGIITFFTMFIYLLLRYWHLKCETNYKWCSCCTKGCGTCTCSRMTSFMHILVTAIFLWIAMSVARQFDYVQPPIAGFKTSFECIRHEQFLTAFIPCKNVYAFPFYLLAVDFLFKMVPASWDFKSERASICGKVLSFIFSIFCVSAYTGIIFWIIWNWIWDDYYLVIVTAVLLATQLWGCYATVTGKYLFGYCSLALTSVPLLAITSIVALSFHYQQNCKVPLVHEEFLSSPPQFGFSLDWEIWLFLATAQLIHVLLLMFASLRRLKMEEVKCLLRCFMCYFFPIILVTICGYVVAAQAIDLCCRKHPEKVRSDRELLDRHLKASMAARKRREQKEDRRKACIDAMARQSGR